MGLGVGVGPKDGGLVENCHANENSPLAELGFDECTSADEWPASHVDGTWNGVVHGIPGLVCVGVHGIVTWLLRTDRVWTQRLLDGRAFNGWLDRVCTLAQGFSM